MNQDISAQLKATALALVDNGKGILAADESSATIEKRFASINLPSTEDNRRAYREMLFTTPGISEFISGVILFDETLRQSSSQGMPFPKLLADQGIIPGIKVDQGLEPLPGSSEEKLTKGLDGLAGRLAEYRNLGARFAKWRAVITIGSAIPTDDCIDINAQGLAEYAAVCQAAGIVPIVEPEVLMDGDNTIEVCESVTLNTLQRVFAALRNKKVNLEGMLLKPNMVIAGKKSPVQAASQQIAEATLRVFNHVVPPEVPGIVFLSGGQSAEEATLNLNEINKSGPQPWKLSFSFGRALQNEALKTWAGEAANVPAAQQAFFSRAKLVSLAALGQYLPEMEELPPTPS